MGRQVTHSYIWRVIHKGKKCMPLPCKCDHVQVWESSIKGEDQELEPRKERTGQRRRGRKRRLIKLTLAGITDLFTSEYLTLPHSKGGSPLTNFHTTFNVIGHRILPMCCRLPLVCKIWLIVLQHILCQLLGLLNIFREHLMKMLLI